MLTLLGSLLGFGSSFLPKILGFFQDKADKRHELLLLTKQAELAVQEAGLRLEAAGLDAEIREIEAIHLSDRATGVPWVDGLRGSVRPVITYIFMALFVFVEVSVTLKAMASGLAITDAAGIVWTESVQAMFATILAFWFGGRDFNKKR